MGEQVDVDDLVGAAEIAERLEVANSRVVHQWRARDLDFPEPVVSLKQAMLWLWPEVERWAQATGRL